MRKSRGTLRVFVVRLGFVFGITVVLDLIDHTAALQFENELRRRQ